MAKKQSSALNFVAWLTGVIVSLAVGFALTGGTLTVPYIPGIVTVLAGWVVIITTLIGVVLAVLNK